MENYYAPSIRESVSSNQGDFLSPLPDMPTSLDNIDNCFSDRDSHCESEEYLDETADELEAVKSYPQLVGVGDSVFTDKPDVQLMVNPTRFLSSQIHSPCLPKRDSSTFPNDKSLSRSEEQLWKKSKSMSAAIEKPPFKQRYSSDAILKEDRPPLPPRTCVFPPQENKKIVSKPLPPIPIDEEEYIPNGRKLSTSLDCLRSPTLEEEASPYLSPIDLNLQLKREDQSLRNASSSSHLSDRPPLPALPTEPPQRGGVSITRSNTQYIPGKRYSHKRSRSSNCDFLRSMPKEEMPYNHQKDSRNSALNSYATLRPSTFMACNLRDSSASPSELDLESSLKKKNSFHRKTINSKQVLIPDETDRDTFGTYTRMSPAPSFDLRSSLCQPEELPRDASFYKLPNDSSSNDIKECASFVPPRRGERRKARRWETHKDDKDKITQNPANKLYWQQRRQTSEGPRYVTQPGAPQIQNSSNLLITNRHDTNSKRSSRDSNIYEHVDEDILESLRNNHSDDYRSSAETDVAYRSTTQPGVFPHPPTANEWHYFMYMWKLFLQWMTEHTPPEVYSVPSNVPANTGNTPPLIVSHNIQEYYDEVRKQSVTSYTSINCDWIKDIANTSSFDGDIRSRVSGTFSPQGSNDTTEATAVVDKQPSPPSQNPHPALKGNGKSVSSFDSGICHSQNDDSNSGDS